MVLYGVEMSISSTLLKNFIVKNFFIADSSEIDCSTALFSSGILDSFNLVDLVNFIENEAEIRINPFDMSLENLDSIDKIIEFVNRKKG